MFWNKKSNEDKVAKELREKIEKQKESYVMNYLTLICNKKYGDDWKDDVEIQTAVGVLKLHPEIYEALCEHAYEKVGQFLNEDGTGNELCIKWKELL